MSDFDWGDADKDAGSGGDGGWCCLGLISFVIILGIIIYNMLR